ncbi:SRPBCC family protein [Rhodococcus oryzae]|uniref:SRPBCC family protein n=1 Tax=Rhodococcus oryzae TaxID=2571143 RepID=A0ABY2REZ5_9NOCA|nr:SRPBCC family protein [Rhodococcus oryzae]TJZ74916.1 SRPBCC family protein [Rhodococcus oryzae]
MSNTEIQLTQHVAATPAKVWAVLTDLDAAATTLTGVISTERVAGEGYVVGTRWRETRKMLGKEATEEMWVAEVDPERRTVVKANSRGADYTTSFTLAPSGDGTDLSMTFTADPGKSSVLAKLLMKVFGGLGAKATAKMMAQDLRDIAAAAEAA